MKEHDATNLFRTTEPARHSSADASSDVHSLVIPGGSAFFVELANSAWDLRRSTTDLRSPDANPSISRIARHVDRLWESLEQVGVNIQDHTNQPFDSGQSLDVLAFQPTPGIDREVVIETIRPTVYLQDHRIQVGQIIVATPQLPSEETDK